MKQIQNKNINKTNFSNKLEIVSDFEPSGDQPQAIKTIVKNLQNGENEQVLLGVTGSGKTFTMAKVIEELQKPTLIMAPNKTLAAQLYGEMKSLFPNNAVEYFVSYYDYYTPEAYVPRSDTYIEKESSINEQIDRLRHSATRSLVERRDTIIIASVSCIFGIGSVDAYSSMSFTLEKNQNINRDDIIKKLVELLYKRRDMDFRRGSFRAKGDILEISDQDWIKGMEVYYLNIVRSSRVITPIMQKQKNGSIINISTFAIFEPDQNFPTSGVFRSGLAAFTKLYSDKYAKDNIRMNNILPGFIDSLPEKEEFLKRIPLQRYGKVNEISAVVELLASDGGAYITGQNIRVDGGITRSV